MRPTPYFKTHKGVYIIAEVGINHNGSIKEAKNLISAAFRAGANGVKIQVRDLASIYTKAVLQDSLKAEQGTQYLLDQLNKVHFSYDQIRELFQFAESFEGDFFATPFDLKSAHFLHDLGVGLYKIGSPDLTSLPLIELVASFGKPMILSTGMSEEAEILQVNQVLIKLKADYSLLHCNSTYPASLVDINLRYMPILGQKTGARVGYSGHEQGYATTLAAVGMGATIIERHITSDVGQEGPDHRSSLTISDFEKMVRDVRDVESSLGEPVKKYNQGERNNRIALAKSLVARTVLSKGKTLESGDFDFKSPARGISPLTLPELTGKKLLKDMEKDEYFSFDIIEGALPPIKDSFKIDKKWGLVGRLNDFEDFLYLQPKLIEIHLTWRDLVEKKSMPQKIFEQDLVLHAPEYYHDKLIDFTSDDPNVTEYSLEMLQKSIALARELAPKFAGQKDSRGPRVVVHPGGHFTKPTTSNKSEQYKLLKKRLQTVDTSGVRILVENMPPLPWYFGGQWYNTVFLDPGEIAQFAKEMDWNVCYDTSHAQLYCHFAGLNIADFTKKILDRVGYLHIADAKGSSGEGVQIGQGDIDFDHLFAILHQLDVGFIPEIWQGHLNRGRGFKEALVTIETMLKNVSGKSCSCTDPNHDHSGFAKI